MTIRKEEGEHGVDGEMNARAGEHGRNGCINVFKVDKGSEGKMPGEHRV